MFSALKRFLSCFLAFHFLIGSILPSMECWEELTRLPQLLRHYDMHKKASNGQMSFLEFMQMHYGTGSKHAENPPESEKEQHAHLPSMTLSGYSLHSFVLPTFPLVPFEQSLVTEFKEIPDFYWNNLYSFQHQSSLLNPPNFG